MIGKLRSCPPFSARGVLSTSLRDLQQMDWLYTSRTVYCYTYVFHSHQNLHRVETPSSWLSTINGAASPAEKLRTEQGRHKKGTCNTCVFHHCRVCGGGGVSDPAAVHSICQKEKSLRIIQIRTSTVSCICGYRVCLLWDTLLSRLVSHTSRRETISETSPNATNRGDHHSLRTRRKRSNLRLRCGLNGRNGDAKYLNLSTRPAGPRNGREPNPSATEPQTSMETTAMSHSKRQP